MASKKKGLGKGLDALLGDTFGTASKKQAVVTQKTIAKPQTLNDLQEINNEAGSRSSLASELNNKTMEHPPEGVLVQIPVDLCQRGKYQPRKAMDQESLEELAASIKSQGVMQPIIIREIESAVNTPDADKHYEIIAGERRWRASQLAGLDHVPAIVKNVPDEAAVAMALIENLQRDDLNPMDEAYALIRLQEEFDLTHQQIADVVGKSRAAVSNSIRLSGLHADVKRMLENGDIEMGHARALLTLDSSEQVSVAKEIVNQALTVRRTEALVKNRLAGVKQEKAPDSTESDPNILRLQNDLSEKLGVPVAVKHGSNGKGQLVLRYNNLEELDGILEHIK